MKLIQKSLLLLLLAYAAVASTTTSSTLSHLENSALRSLWGYWKTFHNKAYSALEEVTKFAIFAENYRKISHYNRVNKDVKLALNKFSDLTQQEFKDLHIGGYVPSTNVVQKKLKGLASPKVDFELLHFPESVDWREKGAVTEVKNQQQCGSCWAFSAAGALESLYFLTHGKLLSFSEQQIVDCDSQDGGCNGGLPEQAFQYTAQAGIETEQDYPYTGSDGQCRYDESKAIKVNTGSQAISPNNVGALKAALVSQPVAVAIQADQHVFQFYRSGVLKSGCGDDLNHAVLAVGYTKIDGEEAFIVKNSWGTKWGSEGYVYISTDGTQNYGSGVCGILGDPVVPTV